MITKRHIWSSLKNIAMFIQLSLSCPIERKRIPKPYSTEPYPLPKKLEVGMGILRFCVSMQKSRSTLIWTDMRGSRNFRQGGPGQSDKKKLWQRFFSFSFFFCWSSAYCTEVKWLISKKSIIFQGSRGVQQSRWGSNFFQGGPIAYSL